MLYSYQTAEVIWRVRCASVACYFPSVIINSLTLFISSGAYLFVFSARSFTCLPHSVRGGHGSFLFCFLCCISI